MMIYDAKSEHEKSGECALGLRLFLNKNNETYLTICYAYDTRKSWLPNTIMAEREERK